MSTKYTYLVYGIVTGFIGTMMFASLSVCWPGHSLRQARVTATRFRLKTLAEKVRDYKEAHGVLPESLETFVSPDGTNTYLLYDSWRTPFRFTVSNETFEIRSAGPNTKFGDTDDLANQSVP